MVLSLPRESWWRVLPALVVRTLPFGYAVASLQQLERPELLARAEKQVDHRSLWGSCPKGGDAAQHPLFPVCRLQCPRAEAVPRWRERGRSTATAVPFWGRSSGDGEAECTEVEPEPVLRHGGVLQAPVIFRRARSKHLSMVGDCHAKATTIFTPLEIVDALCMNLDSAADMHPDRAGVRWPRAQQGRAASPCWFGPS